MPLQLLDTFLCKIMISKYRNWSACHGRLVVLALLTIATFSTLNWHKTSTLITLVL